MSLGSVREIILALSFGINITNLLSGYSFLMGIAMIKQPVTNIPIIYFIFHKYKYIPSHLDPTFRTTPPLPPYVEFRLMGNIHVRSRLTYLPTWRKYVITLLPDILNSIGTAIFQINVVYHSDSVCIPFHIKSVNALNILTSVIILIKI